MKNKIELINKIIELVENNDGDIKSNNSYDAMKFKQSLNLWYKKEQIVGNEEEDYLNDRADKIYNTRYQHHDVSRNILMQAIFLGCNKIAELLINSGFNLDDDDGKYSTALIYAIIKDATEIAELLIEKGSKLSGQYSDSCLLLAEQRGNKKIANLLEKIMDGLTSKVIQITTTQNRDTILCEDGSIWERHHEKTLSNREWTCILKGISDRQKIIFDKRRDNLNN